MKAITSPLLAALLCASIVSVASAQVGQVPKREERRASEDQAKTTPNDPSSDSVAGNPKDKPDESSIFVYLIDGGRLQVEDLRETNDGIWYRRGGVTTLLDPKRVARIERPSTAQIKSTPVVDPLSGSWTIADSTKVENFFFTKFGRPLPTTAFGQSDLHNRWGLDHRQGLDVGLHPDSREGLALREFLTTERIPFMVFRSAIPGVATGPHIHIGNASHRFLPR